MNKQTEINKEEENKQVELSLESVRNVFQKEFVDLTGKQATISEVKLFEQPEIERTKKGVEYKNVRLTLVLDNDTQINCGGFKRYKIKDVFGEVSLWKQGQNATAVLFQKLCKFLGLEVDDITERQFLEQLQSKVVELEAVTKSFGGKEYRKNAIKNIIS